jgi:hypothetical protein
MRKDTAKNILLLCNYAPEGAGTIVDHIEAFKLYSKNDYFILSNLGDLPDWLDLSRFDALVIHYSLVACYDSYISTEARQRIRNFKGFKAAFVQDDYRWINDTVKVLNYMGIHALFPLTGPDIINKVYSPEKLPNVRKETVLAGYVPKPLLGLKVKPYRERGLDVGYRARKLPAWMGSHTLQKWHIAQQFSRDAERFCLKIDISCCEKDRIYGEHWIDFVSNCRATLGTESGASVCDFTGEIQRNVEEHLLKNPSEDFETLRSLYFKNEDCQIMMNVISPRCFESAALRTLMILYEGEYSGILIPWRHYVPLKRDHSNMWEVVQILQSPDEAQKIIDQAFEEVAKNPNYSYSALIELVDRVMDEEWSDSLKNGEKPYLQVEFDWLVKYKPNFIERFSYRQLKKSRWLPFTSSARLHLKMPTHLRAVAIHWDEDLINAPKQFRLDGFRNRKIQYTQEVLNANQEAFQSISIPIGFPAIDFLEISQMTDIKPSSSQHFFIYALSFETFLKQQRLIDFKHLAYLMLARCWMTLPERVRFSLKPKLKKIIIRQQHLFKRIFG